MTYSTEGISLPSLLLGFWVGERLAPGSYSLWSIYRFMQRLDVKAFEAAWREVCRRNDAYRMVFAEQDGVPYARVLSGDPDNIHFHDATHLDEASFRKMAVDLANRPIDLARCGPSVAT